MVFQEEREMPVFLGWKEKQETWAVLDHKAFKEILADREIWDCLDPLEQ